MQRSQLLGVVCHPLVQRRRFLITWVDFYWNCHKNGFNLISSQLLCSMPTPCLTNQGLHFAIRSCMWSHNAINRLLHFETIVLHTLTLEKKIKSTLPLMSTIKAVRSTNFVGSLLPTDLPTDLPFLVVLQWMTRKLNLGSSLHGKKNPSE